MHMEKKLSCGCCNTDTNFLKSCSETARQFSPIKPFMPKGEGSDVKSNSIWTLESHEL